MISIGTVAFEWRFFFIIIFQKIETIRNSFVFNTVPLKDVIKIVLNVFIYGEYTAGSIHTKVFLPICGIYFLYINFKYIIERQLLKIFQDYYNWIIFFIGFNSVVYGINKWQPFRDFVARFIPILYGFSFERTVWFNGFLWCLAVVLIVSRISNKSVITIVILCSFFPFILSGEVYNPIHSNLKLIEQDIFETTDNEFESWKEFYAEDLFEKIKLEIDYRKEWSVAFGFHPAVLNYNGISTLDGYHSFYPLDYKKDFRKLIKPEFDFDEYYRNYYDNWGGRAYVFSKDCDSNFPKDYLEKPTELHIDMKKFKEFGGKYIFSRVEISNLDTLGIQEMGVFKDKNTFFSVYVYSI